MARSFTHLCIAAAVAWMAAASGVQAQDKPPSEAKDYPTKPVRFILASAPGGGIDTVGRIVAQKLTEAWPQPVIAENRPGSGNTIATALVAKAPPDGYTLLVQSVGVSYAGALRKNLPFDAARDLAPVVLVVSQPNLLAVHTSLPVKSVREFIRFARSKPGELNYGSAGAGGASHMAAELLSSMAGIRMVTVQYKGIGPAMTGLLSGEVAIGVLGISTMLPHVASGRIRALGVTGAKRSALLPDVPTIAEAGVPGYAFDAWYAILAPAMTPPAVIAKVNADVNRALQQPEVRQRFASIGMEPMGGSAQHFAEYFKAEQAKWAKVIREAKIATE